MTTHVAHIDPAHARLSIAETFVLLSHEWPLRSEPLVAWSDADFALVGAVLIDLSYAGVVDSDLENLMILEHAPALDGHLAESMALALLKRYGPTLPLDLALNALVDRVGDLRAATLAALARKGIQLTESASLSWGFRQTTLKKQKLFQATALRAALSALVESDDLPDPDQASIIALLSACDIAGPVLGGSAYKSWLRNHGQRLDTIRRLDLVGHAVSAAVVTMRQRLRTYLLDASTTDQPKGKRQDKPGEDYTRSNTTWEWRAFWPEHETVNLPASWGKLQQLIVAEPEALEDHYLFVHGKKDNIKIRGKGLKIKPVVEAFDDFIAFSSSVKFSFPKKTSLLADFLPRMYEVRGKTGDIKELLEVMSATGYQPNVLTVAKQRRVHTMVHGVQMELARIQIGNQTFHSISLESPYLTALRILARHIPVGCGRVAGYSDFLESIVHPRRD